MSVYHFVDLGLRVELFFEKKGTVKNDLNFYPSLVNFFESACYSSKSRKRYTSTILLMCLETLDER